MNSLSSRYNLLTSHEEIIRVSVVRVSRVEHGIEWSDSSWVTVKHVEISIILLSDKFSKSFFTFSAEVIKFTLLDSCCLKHLDSFFEVKLDNWLHTFEVLEWILCIDCGKLLLESGRKSLEDVAEHASKHIKNLEVMFFDDHFHIKTCEFTEMSIGI